MAQLLVEKGAKVNEATNDGATPLFIAALKGHQAVAQYLVEQGAAVNQADSDGRTQLFIATQNDPLD